MSSCFSFVICVLLQSYSTFLRYCLCHVQCRIHYQFEHSFCPCHSLCQNVCYVIFSVIPFSSLDIKSYLPCLITCGLILLAIFLLLLSKLSCCCFPLHFPIFLQSSFHLIFVTFCLHSTYISFIHFSFFQCIFTQFSRSFRLLYFRHTQSNFQSI